MLPFFFLCFSQFSVERRSSYPYITGDTWRPFCNWQLSETETFEPQEVKQGDTIFVEYQRLETFRKMAPQIKFPYILITPNVENYSDNPLPGPHSALLEEKNLAAWFLQNIDRPATDRLIPIPIGLSNNFWNHGSIEPTTHERDILAYLNFNIETNPIMRKTCLNYFSTQPWAHLAEPKAFSDYLSDLSRSHFVVSPPGSGPDCHRTWEALCAGCYPIVLSSTLNPLYEDLPVLIVDQWADVTCELLQRKMEEFANSQWNFDKIYIPYWFEKVSALQKQII